MVKSSHFVILNQTLNQNLFSKSCSVWHAIWECHVKKWKLSIIFGTVTFNICCQMIFIGYSLSLTCYLWLATCYLLSVYFYLKLAITCKNLFLSLVVVRLFIFLVILGYFWLYLTNIWVSWAISGSPWLSWYMRLSWAARGYIWPSLVIFEYLWLSL